METKLGKIQSVEFGFGGYQDAMIGISFTLSGDWGGVNDFWGNWSCKPSKNAEWTTKDQVVNLGGVVMRIASLLEDAKVKDIADLKGVPVEVKFAGGMLQSWRILKEVL